MKNNLEEYIIKNIKTSSKNLIRESKIKESSDKLLWQKEMLDEYNIYVVMMGLLDKKIDIIKSESNSLIGSVEKNHALLKLLELKQEVKDCIVSRIVYPIQLRDILLESPTYDENFKEKLFEIKHEEISHPTQYNICGNFVRTYLLGYDSLEHINEKNIIKVYKEEQDKIKKYIDFPEVEKEKFVEETNYVKVYEIKRKVLCQIVLVDNKFDK